MSGVEYGMIGEYLICREQFQQALMAEQQRAMVMVMKIYFIAI